MKKYIGKHVFPAAGKQLNLPACAPALEPAKLPAGPTDFDQWSMLCTVLEKDRPDYQKIIVFDNAKDRPLYWMRGTQPCCDGQGRSLYFASGMEDCLVGALFTLVRSGLYLQLVLTRPDPELLDRLTEMDWWCAAKADGKLELVCALQAQAGQCPKNRAAQKALYARILQLPRRSFFEDDWQAGQTQILNRFHAQRSLLPCAVPPDDQAPVPAQSGLAPAQEPSGTEPYALQLGVTVAGRKMMLPLARGQMVCLEQSAPEKQQILHRLFAQNAENATRDIIYFTNHPLLDPFAAEMVQVRHMPHLPKSPSVPDWPGVFDALDEIIQAQTDKNLVVVFDLDMDIPPEKLDRLAEGMRLVKQENGPAVCLVYTGFSPSDPAVVHVIEDNEGLCTIQGMQGVFKIPEIQIN